LLDCPPLYPGAQKQARSTGALYSGDRVGLLWKGLCAA